MLHVTDCERDIRGLTKHNTDLVSNCERQAWVVWCACQAYQQTRRVGWVKLHAKTTPVAARAVRLHAFVRRGKHGGPPRHCGGAARPLYLRVRAARMRCVCSDAEPRRDRAEGVVSRRVGSAKRPALWRPEHGPPPRTQSAHRPGVRRRML